MKYTVLVNKDNLWKNKNTFELITIKDINNCEIILEKETYNAYIKLKKYLEERNINIGITSSLRTEEEQNNLFDEIKKEKGEEYARTHVAIGKTSEHLTGLAIDIGILINNQYIDELSEETRESFKKIHSVIKEFGFILRYPEGKEKITGYAYEPWHLRYVGVVPATIIMDENITLEEYLKEFSGILYINKRKGMTSFDVVHEVEKIFGIKRVGHTGTLDPLAEGVLVVTIGKACKIVELLTAKDKEYISEVKLGIKTDTYDIEGNVLENRKINRILPIKETLNSFKKTYLQEVPIYSAVKVGGKKLYDYARNNQKVALPKKEVTIKEIELLDNNNYSFTFKVLVSKGCYIRSLIQDICKSMNTIGTMSSLIRTKQGRITLEDTNTLEDLKNKKYRIHSIEEVLDYKTIEVDNELYKKISNGVKINNNFLIKDKVMFTYQKKLIGIYEVEGKHLKVWKNFI